MFIILKAHLKVFFQNKICILLFLTGLLLSVIMGITLKPISLSYRVVPNYTYLTFLGFIIFFNTSVLFWFYYVWLGNDLFKSTPLSKNKKKYVPISKMIIFILFFTAFSIIDSLFVILHLGRTEHGFNYVGFKFISIHFLGELLLYLSGISIIYTIMFFTPKIAKVSKNYYYFMVPLAFIIPALSSMTLHKNYRTNTSVQRYYKMDDKVKLGRVKFSWVHDRFDSTPFPTWANANPINLFSLLQINEIQPVVFYNKGSGIYAAEKRIEDIKQERELLSLLSAEDIKEINSIKTTTLPTPWEEIKILNTLDPNLKKQYDINYAWEYAVKKGFSESQLKTLINIIKRTYTKNENIGDLFGTPPPDNKLNKIVEIFLNHGMSMDKIIKDILLDRNVLSYIKDIQDYNWHKPYGIWHYIIPTICFILIGHILYLYVSLRRFKSKNIYSKN